MSFVVSLLPCSPQPLFFVQGAVIDTNSAENLQSDIFSDVTRGPTLSIFAHNRSWQQVFRGKVVPEAVLRQETVSYNE